MMLAKRPRRALVQHNLSEEPAITTRSAELNGCVACETLIEYFLHISLISGIFDDMHVFSEAWTITIRVLMSADVLNFSPARTDDSHRKMASLPRKFKAVVVAACALAVDACGDFEAAYAHSAFAWATLFVNQIQETDVVRTTESDCCQLMRMKMIAGRALRWDIGFYNPISSFYRYVRKLRESFACDCCQSLFGQNINQHEQALQTLSFLLLPIGKPCDIIALTAIAFLHHHTKSDLMQMERREFAKLPSCLNPFLSHLDYPEHVHDCLGIVEQSTEYVDFLLEEILCLRTSTAVKTLSSIEQEYCYESTTDTQSSA